MLGRWQAHSVEVVHLLHFAQRFGCFDYGYSLDRDRIAKSCAFAIHDAWNEDIASHSFGFARLNDLVVRIDRLQMISPTNQNQRTWIVLRFA